MLLTRGRRLFDRVNAQRNIFFVRNLDTVLFASFCFLLFCSLTPSCMTNITVNIFFRLSTTVTHRSPDVGHYERQGCGEMVAYVCLRCCLPTSPYDQVAPWLFGSSFVPGYQFCPAI